MWRHHFPRLGLLQPLRIHRGLQIIARDPVSLQHSIDFIDYLQLALDLARFLFTVAHLSPSLLQSVHIQLRFL